MKPIGVAELMKRRGAQESSAYDYFEMVSESSSYIKHATEALVYKT